MKHLDCDQDVEAVLKELHEWAGNGVGTSWSAEQAFDAQAALHEYADELGYDL